MVDLENEEGDDFGKQLRWCARQLRAALGQAELTLEGPPQAQREQQVVQNF